MTGDGEQPVGGDVGWPVGDERASYLRELAAVVWPGPPVAHLARGGRTGHLVLPSASRPRLLLPDAPPRVAAAAVRQSTEAVGTASRLRRAVLATALRLGPGRHALRDRLLVEPAGSLPAYLAGLLHERAHPPGPPHRSAHPTRGPVDAAHPGGRAVQSTQPANAPGTTLWVAVHLGPARANRKPVLQLLDRTGQPVAFAKLGVDPLTRALVDAEAAALRRLAAADLPGVDIAEVWHHGDWQQHHLLVQRALPVHRRRAAAGPARVAEQAAMVTVSRCLGIRERPWTGSPYARRLTAALSGLHDRPEASRLRAVLTVVDHANPVLRFGAAHGDWNGGNSAVLADGRVLLWDWERFEADVPVGFDALHRRLQTAVTRERVAPEQAADQVLAAASGLLAPFGHPDQVAGLVAVLWLVDLALRYLRDRQAEAGAHLGHVDRWLLPAVERWSATRYGERGRIG